MIFLILTRKKKDPIAPYADALEALDVPLEVSGARAFGDSAEVRALTLLLRALAEPQDAVLLVAVFVVRCSGWSYSELFAFKQGGGWFTELKDAVKALIELHMNVTSFEMNKFMKLLAIVGFLGLIPSVVGGLLGMNVVDNPWPVTLGQVAFGIAMGMAVSLYVFAIKGWLR